MKINCSACGAQNDNSDSECKYCGNALSIQPGNLESKIKELNEHGNKFKLAEVAFEGEDFDEAITYYNACLEIDTEFFEAWYKKGLAILKTSTIGNFKSQQAISAFKQAINNSPNADNFKKRLKKDVYPFICNYYLISVNHFKEFSSLQNSSHELGEKIIKANDTVDFIIDNIGLELEEIKKLYKVIHEAAMIQSKVIGQKALAQLNDKNAPAQTSTLFRDKIHYIVNDRLIPLWEELEPETAPQKMKGLCFIATAAMGDYNHPVVVDLRTFRDEWLLKRKWGISFTNWYYTHGPKAASIIEQSKFLRKLTFCIVIKPLQVITKLMR